MVENIVNVQKTWVGNLLSAIFCFSFDQNLKSLRTVDDLDVFHQEFGCFLYEQIVYHVDRLEKEIKVHKH